MIGEGLMIGAAVLLGGLTLRYIQKHPFYKHSSQNTYSNHSAYV